MLRQHDPGLCGRAADAFTAVNYGVRLLSALAGGLLGTWLGLRSHRAGRSRRRSLYVLWLLPSPSRAHALPEQDLEGRGIARPGAGG